MLFFTSLVIFILAFKHYPTPVFAVPSASDTTFSLAKRDIEQNLYDDFVRYTKYSSAAHQDSCPKPLGNNLVLQFENSSTNSQGFIARDDSRKEIVVSFRGSDHPLDYLLDLLFVLVPFRFSALPNSIATVASRTKVHRGFLASFNSVAPLVVDAVAKELASNSNYTIITTGHSLGAALASMSAVVLKANFPDTVLKVFTVGQPRTGDRAYADLLENVVSEDNLFRAVHTTDFAANFPPSEFGYQHHATEYWNFADPASPSTVRRCTGREDLSCSRSTVSTIMDAGAPHNNYFGQVIGRDTLTLCASS